VVNVFNVKHVSYVTHVFNVTQMEGVRVWDVADDITTEFVSADLKNALEGMVEVIFGKVRITHTYTQIHTHTHAHTHTHTHTHTHMHTYVLHDWILYSFARRFKLTPPHSLCALIDISNLCYID
jgi:ABC-type Zn2+ transport system substrate-binding protein/surface adhesin